MTKVEAYSWDGTATTVWEAIDATACGSYLGIVLADSVISKTIKISTQPSSYAQIDAVQICGSIVTNPPATPPQSPVPPLPPPECNAQVDIVLVVDNSQSVGSSRPSVLAFVRAVVGQFKMGATAAQIAYVEFDTSVVTHSSLTASLSTITTALDNAPAVGSGTYTSRIRTQVCTT